MAVDNSRLKRLMRCFFMMLLCILQLSGALVAVSASGQPAAVSSDSTVESPYSLENKDDDHDAGYLDALPVSPISLSTPWDSNIWIRVVNGFAIPDLSGDLVEKYEQAYSSDPEYIRKLIERSRPYLYYVVNEVERRGLPMEIVLLPMIESAFNPYAYSRAHASGLWQIIPSTGRNLGLRQSRDHDERLDIIAATRSALDYLEYLHSMFPDWQLALAAYNWGEGALNRSVSRNQNRGRAVDYWSVSMPSETRNYVPKLQALKNIIRNPSAYGVEIPKIPDRPYFQSVLVDKKMRVTRIADLADISVHEFSSLNPAFKKPVIRGSSENQYRLLIPVEKAETFEGRINSNPLTIAPASTASKDVKPSPSRWISYQVKPGESLEELAPRFGVSVDELKNVNGLKDEVRIGAGQTLWVPPDDVVEPKLTTSIDNSEDNEEDQLDSAMVRWVYHTVRRNDTLASIARHYGVSIDDIRRWNGLKGHALNVGMTMKLRIHEKSASRHHRHRHSYYGHGLKLLRTEADVHAKKPSNVYKKKKHKKH